MSRTLGLDREDFARLVSAFAEYGDEVRDAANEAIHDTGPLIFGHINPLIHPSGRTFKGHGASASVSDWPRFDTGEKLAITIGTKARYRYLYFPDDGSSTARHYGDQRFMERGAEDAAPEVIDKIQQAIISRFERS